MVIFHLPNWHYTITKTSMNKPSSNTFQNNAYTSLGYVYKTKIIFNLIQLNLFSSHPKFLIQITKLDNFPLTHDHEHHNNHRRTTLHHGGRHRKHNRSKRTIRHRLLVPNSLHRHHSLLRVLHL